MRPSSGSYPFTFYCESAFLSLSAAPKAHHRRRRQHISSIRWATLDPFDFSSKKGWDDFYAQRGAEDEGTFEYEWHPSIPHASVISDIVPGSSCLMLGCGNSALPAALYDAHRGRGDNGTRVCCLDYSAVCVDAMRDIHGGPGRPGMSFVCADALTLDAAEMMVSLGLAVNAATDPEHLVGGGGALFDAVVDKGLIDALMCGEAWDYDVARLFRGLSTVLRGDGGVYVLISFKLAQSTKDFLTEECSKYGFQWEFDVENKSNDKVSFSIGRRTI